MADLPRQASPRMSSNSISSSPSRPSPLSRPHWPYTTYTGSHGHRPSSSSSIMSAGSATGLGFEYRGPGTPSPSGLVRRTSNLALSTSTASAVPEESTRHWSFTAFEWIVRDVHRLRDHIYNTDNPTDGGDFEILRDSPMLGEGRFKLEVARPAPAENMENMNASNDAQVARSLSLFVTSVMIEYAHTDYEICSSMFAGIKCQDDRVGERGARPDWVWEFWQNDWVFREDSEVWECPLPSLSTLLENPRIKETDSFVICCQIHSPVGPFFPQQPSAAYVPKELLDGLEALLDNANTGDVQFVCLERKEDGDLEPDSPDAATPHSRRSSSSSSTATSAPHTVARKRIIYAHSDILIRRSEYFATMLRSSFSENAASLGERKTYTIIVEEADFVTIYWLLKWVYANWLLFKENDNPKAAIEGAGTGWSAKWLDTRRGQDEWAWTTFSARHPSGDDIGDSRSVTSAESTPGKKGKTPAGSATTSMRGNSSAGSSSSKTAAAPSSSGNSTSTSTARPPPSPVRRANTTGTASTSTSTTNLEVPPPSTADTPSSPTRARKSDPLAAHIPPALSPSSPSFPAQYRPPARPRAPASHPLPLGHGAPRAAPTRDPHAHPCGAPAPASALAMYQVAHRYGMRGLAALALEHMLATLTPARSFALLLASATWEELHKLVEVRRARFGGVRGLTRVCCRTTSSRSGTRSLCLRSSRCAARRSRRASGARRVARRSRRCSGGSALLLRGDELARFARRCEDRCVLAFRCRVHSDLCIEHTAGCRARIAVSYR